MGKLKQAVVASPVEVAMGVAMAAIGIWISTTGDGEVAALGSVLGILGGLSFSWGLTKTYVSDSASEDLRARIRPLEKRLGMLSGEIGQTSRDMLEGRKTQESGCALIMQSATHLSGLLSDLEDMTGHHLDTEGVLASVERVAELSFGLARMSADPQAASEIQAEVASLKRGIANALGGGREYRDEVVKCPNCDASVSSKVGTVAGDSAAPFCESCSTRFHAQWRSDGSVFSRPQGEPSVFKSLSVTCPNCQNDVPLAVAEGDNELKTRFCVNCGARLKIDSSNGTVVDHHAENPLAAGLVRVAPWPAILECTECRQSVSAFYSKGVDYFGVCSTCNRLIKAVSVAEA
jgi:hypothetical protein